jgi:hypothetical protein
MKTNTLKAKILASKAKGVLKLSSPPLKLSAKTVIKESKAVSARVEALTGKMVELESVIRDALVIYLNAEHASFLLSDGFADLHVDRELDPKSRLSEMRALCLFRYVRKSRAVAAKAEMARLLPIIKAAEADQYEASISILKLLGNFMYRRWCRTTDPSRDRGSFITSNRCESNYERWLFPVAASSSGDDATAQLESQLSMVSI